MNKLFQQLERLYFLHGQQWLSWKSDDSDHPAYAAEGLLTPEFVARSLAGESTVVLDLVSMDGMVRAMVLGFERAADWELVAKLHQGMQEDLELPAPAVSVSGRAGYQLWLSLADSVPVEEARRFLAALQRKYLAEMPAASLSFRPAAGVAGGVDLVPALYEATGKWSAFIDPSMGAMFVDESGLDMAPNMDRQADMLSGLASIAVADFQRALRILQADAEAAAGLLEVAAVALGEGVDRPFFAAGRPLSSLNVGNNYTDPKTFLLAVMNDASANADMRIEAAKALLPYFNRQPR